MREKVDDGFYYPITGTSSNGRKKVLVCFQILEISFFSWK